MSIERRQLLKFMASGVVAGSTLKPAIALAYDPERELRVGDKTGRSELPSQRLAELDSLLAAAQSPSIIIPFGDRSPLESYGQFVLRVAKEEGENWNIRPEWIWEVIKREYTQYVLGTRDPQTDFGPFYGPMQFSYPTFKAFYRDPDTKLEDDPWQRTNKNYPELISIMRSPRPNIITALDVIWRLGPRCIYQQWPNTGPAAMAVLGMRSPEEIIIR